MNITIDLEQLMFILTDGQLYTPASIPLKTATFIQEQAGPEVYIENISDKCCNLWTRLGWENELKRREYIENIKKPAFDFNHPITTTQPKVLSKKELTELMMEASRKGDYKEAMRLSQLINQS